MSPIGLMAGEIMFQAAVLSAILYYVARHEADYSIQKVAMVVAGITVGTFCIGAFLHETMKGWEILLQLGFICFMLMTFCWISLKKSLIVTAIFCTIFVGLQFAVAMLAEKIVSSAEPTTTMVEQAYSEMDEIKAEFERQSRQAGAMMEAPPPPPATESAAPALPSAPITVTPLQEPEPAVTVVNTEETPVAVANPADRPVPVQPAADAAQSQVAVAAPAGDDKAQSIPAPSIETDDWIAAKKNLKIGGTMGGKNGRMTAFVNNELVEAGDTVSAHYEQYLYRWKVASISSKGIKFQPMDKTESAATPTPTPAPAKKAPAKPGKKK